MATQPSIMELNIPSHVDPSWVVDYNVYDDARAKQAREPHKALHMLAEEVGRGIYWTPHNGGHWIINDHDLMVEAARNPELFSSNNNLHRDGAVIMIPPMEDNSEPRFAPLSVDPPVHTVYRAPLMRAFAPGVITRMEGRIRELAVGLIEDLLPQGRAEFVYQVGEPLPVTVFMAMMGMPLDRLHEFRGWMDDMASNDQARRASSFVNITAAMGELVTARRAKREDDLISRLLDSDIDGAPPSDSDMLAYCLLLFTAGLDTLVNGITFGMYQLAQEPQLQERVRANPALITPLIEETLRRYGVAMPTRRVTRDAQFGGVQLKKDDRVLLMVPAGNLDPKVFEDPMRFDIDRAFKTHVTFNAGPHRCVGSPLARLELRVFFEEWFARMPNVRLDPQSPPTFRESLNLTIRTLPLVWDPQPARAMH